MKTWQFVVAVGVLAASACREASSDDIADIPDIPDIDEQRRHAAPCDGCKLAIPDEPDGAIPLIVVLHGNRETAAKWFERWRGPALERGWAVLALQCPEARGCDAGKWYRWKPEPGWIASQVRDVARQVDIDPARTYLIAWSGGASYVGQRIPAWPRTFAAIVIHGGGHPPRTDACPARPLPVYFLVGDASSGHRSAKRLRAYLERCDQDVEWDLVPGADHDAEDAALDAAKARRILDWLAERARTRRVG